MGRRGAGWQVDDDPENELSTSPYDGTKGQTWQQAVQVLPPAHSPPCTKLRPAKATPRPAHSYNQ